MAYAPLEKFPDDVKLIDDVAVIIRDEDFLSSSIREIIGDFEFVSKISDNGCYVELTKIAYFKFRKLIKQNNAYLYDFCGEIPNLYMGSYIKK